MSEGTAASGEQLAKATTGIQGLDEITGGGLPRGRPTLVCGGPGCGKTLLGMEFLVRGAALHDEPGLFVSFEETPADLIANVAAMGFDAPALIEAKKLAIDHVRVERHEIEETGEYDLEGLFIRLGYAVSRIGAKRVVLDTIEALFSSFSNEGVLRAELRRLFGWLKERGLTAVITAERGERTFSRHGLEEYVSDCVILLDQRMYDQIATRRLRIVKYRGSPHGTNEYPFLIHEGGFSVLPSTSLRLAHPAPIDRVSTGIPSLDEMLDGKGLHRGSSVLVTGAAGSGKTTIAVHAAAAACRRGERCLYFAFEESPHQLVRNMRSIGVDLEPSVASGLLRVHASRPALHGLEMHLVVMHRHVEEMLPSVVIVDPISNLRAVGTTLDVDAMLVRLIDQLKVRGVTAMFTNLTHGDALSPADVTVASLMDAWFDVRLVARDGERLRSFEVLKARGIAHSRRARELVLSDHGAALVNAVLGGEET